MMYCVVPFNMPYVETWLWESGFPKYLSKDCTIPTALDYSAGPLVSLNKPYKLTVFQTLNERDVVATVHSQRHVCLFSLFKVCIKLFIFNLFKIG